MKKNDLILLFSVITYSFLFYREMLGLNMLLFTVLLTTGLALVNPIAIKSMRWWLVAIASIFTSVVVVWQDSLLSVIANIILLLLLSTVTITKKSSVLVGLIFSIFSVISSPVFMVLDAVERGMNKQSAGRTERLALKPLLTSLAVICAGLFFIMYRASNPVYEAVTMKISLDFLTWDWVFFTLSGLLLMYGIIHHKNIQPLAIQDATKSNELTPINFEEGKTNSNLKHEKFTGILLLTLLNVVLLSVNIVDLIFLYSGRPLPQGVSFSESVHQSVGTLIFSIIIAIAILLYLFRGKQNFSPRTLWLKILAMAWIAQNLFLVCSTVLRNADYIHEFSLTYKRIGVYIYLLLTIIGLIITFIKIWKRKSGWYVLRSCGITFLLVLILCTPVSWSKIVTSYNLSEVNGKGETPDYYYLTQLSYTTLPQMIDVYLEQDKPSEAFSHAIRYRATELLNSWRGTSWKSWSYNKVEVYNKVKEKKDALVKKLPKEDYYDYRYYD